jgi:hypothetical protein
VLPKKPDEKIDQSKAEKVTKNLMANGASHTKQLYLKIQSKYLIHSVSPKPDISYPSLLKKLDSFFFLSSERFLRDLDISFIKVVR